MDDASGMAFYGMADLRLLFRAYRRLLWLQEGLRASAHSMESGYGRDRGSELKRRRTIWFDGNGLNQQNGRFYFMGIRGFRG